MNEKNFPEEIRTVNFRWLVRQETRSLFKYPPKLQQYVRARGLDGVVRGEWWDVPTVIEKI